MKVENQQELEKLIKMMRKTGVETLKAGEIEIRLKPDEPQSKYKRRQADDKEFLEPDLTPEQKLMEAEKILFWSSTPPGLEEPEA